MSDRVAESLLCEHVGAHRGVKCERRAELVATWLDPVSGRVLQRWQVCKLHARGYERGPRAQRPRIERLAL